MEAGGEFDFCFFGVDSGEGGSRYSGGDQAAKVALAGQGFVIRGRPGSTSGTLFEHGAVSGAGTCHEM